jgi:catechol 2,3-dioxygenase-like lactoylglutathione lyase family enzyme
MIPNRPNLNRILETSLYVEDLQRSNMFYNNVLGFKAILQDERMCAMAVSGRQVLLLFRKGGSSMPSETPYGFIPSHDGRGTQHVCFSINRMELAAWEAYLLHADVAIESRLDWPGRGTSLYFRDPDGHSVELATPGLWINDPEINPRE